MKSILRGVWDFIAIPDQNAWYPNPATPTPNATVDGKAATYGIYNLDPYVWFVHDVEHMAGYAFSVDDDVANPAAPGPDRGPGFDAHQPDHQSPARQPANRLRRNPGLRHPDPLVPDHPLGLNRHHRDNKSSSRAARTMVPTSSP